MRFCFIGIALCLALTSPALLGQSKQKDKRQAQKEFRKAMEKHAELSRASGAPRVDVPRIDLSVEAIAGYTAEARRAADELTYHTLSILAEWELQESRQLEAEAFRNSLRSRISSIRRLTKGIRRNPYLTYIDSIDNNGDDNNGDRPSNAVLPPRDKRALLLELDTKAQEIRFHIVDLLEGTASQDLPSRSTFESMTKYLDKLSRIALNVVRP